MANIIETKAGIKLEIISEETFAEDAVIVDKYGQGCNYPTGKCVDGYQVDFDVKVTLKSGKSREFHIVFQSDERTDNMRAYGSSEMRSACAFGCDADEIEDLTDFLEDEGESAEEVDNLLNDRAEELCREWFLANVDEE